MFSRYCNMKKRSDKSISRPPRRHMSDIDTSVVDRLVVLVIIITLATCRKQSPLRSHLSLIGLAEGDRHSINQLRIPNRNNCFVYLWTSTRRQSSDTPPLLSLSTCVGAVSFTTVVKARRQRNRQTTVPVTVIVTRCCKNISKNLCCNVTFL